MRVDETDAQLDDELPDGEQHYRIPLERAEILEAFTVTPDGVRAPLTGTVTAVRQRLSQASPTPAGRFRPTDSTTAVQAREVP